MTRHPSGMGRTPVEEPFLALVPERQACREQGCFASFDGGDVHSDEVRACNRGGPDGGHSHRWDGTRWQLIGVMEHDRSQHPPEANR